MDISNFSSIFRTTVRDKQGFLINSYPVTDRNRWYILRDTLDEDTVATVEFRNNKTKKFEKETYGYSGMRVLIEEARNQWRKDEEERRKEEEKNEEEYQKRLLIADDNKNVPLVEEDNTYDFEQYNSVLDSHKFLSSDATYSSMNYIR